MARTLRSNKDRVPALRRGGSAIASIRSAVMSSIRNGRLSSSPAANAPSAGAVSRPRCRRLRMGCQMPTNGSRTASTAISSSASRNANDNPAARRSRREPSSARFEEVGDRDRSVVRHHRCDEFPCGGDGGRRRLLPAAVRVEWPAPKRGVRFGIDRFGSGKTPARRVVVVVGHAKTQTPLLQPVPDFGEGQAPDIAGLGDFFLSLPGQITDRVDGSIPQAGARSHRQVQSVDGCLEQRA